MKDRVHESNACVMQGYAKWPENRLCGCSEHCQTENATNCPVGHHPIFSGNQKVCVRGIVGFSHSSLEHVYKTLRQKNADLSQVVTIFCIHRSRDGANTVENEKKLDKTLCVEKENYKFSCVPTVYESICYVHREKNAVFKKFTQNDQAFVRTPVYRQLSKLFLEPGDLYCLYSVNAGETLHSYHKSHHTVSSSFWPMLYCLVEVMDFIIYACGPRKVVHLDLHADNILFKVVDDQYVPCIIDWDVGAKNTDMMTYMEMWIEHYMDNTVYVQFPIEALLYTIGYRILQTGVNRQSISNSKDFWTDEVEQKKTIQYIERVVKDLRDCNFKHGHMQVDKHFEGKNNLILFMYLSYYEQFTAEQKADKLSSMLLLMCSDHDAHKMLWHKFEPTPEYTKRIFELVFIDKESRNMLYDLQSVARFIAMELRKYNGPVTPDFSTLIQNVRIQVAEMIDPKNSVAVIREKFTNICTLVKYKRTSRKNCVKTQTPPTVPMHRPQQRKDTLLKVSPCYECP